MNCMRQSEIEKKRDWFVRRGSYPKLKRAPLLGLKLRSFNSSSILRRACEGARDRLGFANYTAALFFDSVLSLNDFASAFSATRRVAPIAQSLSCNLEIWIFKGFP